MSLRIRISTYFYLFSLAMTALLMTREVLLGLAYLIATLPCIVFTLLARNRHDSVRVPILTAAFAVFAMYLLRPVFLGFHPEFFGYPLLGQISSAVQISGLLYLGAFATAFLGGLYGVLSIAGKKFSTHTRPMRVGIIAKLHCLFLLLLLGLLALWLTLMLGFNVGVKGKSSTLEVLRLILPVTLVVPSALSYLIHSKARNITSIEKLMAIFIVMAMSIAITMSGSKSASFLFFLYILVFFLIKTGDFHLKFSRVLLYTIIIPSLIIFSVIAANVIKYTGFSGLLHIGDYISNISDFGLYIIDRITVRLNGYDGLLASLLDHPLGLEPVLRWRNIATGALAQLLPGVALPGLPTGKAVGIYFSGRALDDEYAGALGMFGIFHFMHGGFGGILVTCLTGSFFGLCFTLWSRVKIGTIEYSILAMVLCHQMVHWVNSGNLDNLIQQFVIAMTHSCFYYTMLQAILKITPKKVQINFSPFTNTPTNTARFSR